MPDQDISAQLQSRIQAALQSNTALCIRGGNSKSFYGREPRGEALDVGDHRGIVNYEPTELVMSARAGTPLREIEQTLAAHNQMLAFEPPYFAEQATLGGTIACNLSGPRRAYSGAARDFVLGTRIINGKAQILRFGGEVMKNVAGYDVSRLMAGAMGTLGVLLEVSLKVLPRPAQELTLQHGDITAARALQTLGQWALTPLPLSASSYHDGQLFIRLCGTEEALRSAHRKLGGEALDEQQAQNFWQSIKEQTHAFFNTPGPLWRLSVARDAAPIDRQDPCLYEWGGAQRWLISQASAQTIRDYAAQAGGHAIAYRRADTRETVFDRPSPALMKIHQQLKQAFDPQGILNPGRQYHDL